MKVALVGLLQSGKSTILASISGKEIPAIGSTAIEEAIVPVPDERIELLREYYNPKKITYATIDCLDVPGFNFTDEHGRAAARRLINKIRTVDMLVLAVRAFENPAVPPYRNTVNPDRDLAELQTELLLADLELVSTRIENLEKQVHKPTKTQAHDKAELALQKKLQETIESEKPISSAIETDEERAMIKSLGFLTLKPIVIVVNIDENQLEKKFDLSNRLDSSVPVITFCAKLEYELSQLDAESKAEFMADFGIIESAVGKFAKSCYSALNLISFLTTASNEARAWPIKKDTPAVEAAGKIHTDLQRGFIRAETFSIDDLKEFGNEKALKAAGKIRLEGKDYIVQDGDIINFRFNV
jgi:GTP-binding protein YchF